LLRSNGFDGVFGGGCVINIDELVKSRQRGRHSKKLQMQVERSEIPLAGARPSTSRSALSDST
jgi:hypothetical protein